jgi:hypothetical protein
MSDPVDDRPQWEIDAHERDDLSPIWSSGDTVPSRSGGIMVHPERGELQLTDVVVSNAHDGLHHCWDIETILGRADR